MGTYKPKCEHCNVLVINNVVCHELGCPSDSVYVGDEDDDKNPEIETWDGD